MDDPISASPLALMTGIKFLVRIRFRSRDPPAGSDSRFRNCSMPSFSEPLMMPIPGSPPVGITTRPQARDRNAVRPTAPSMSPDGSHATHVSSYREPGLDAADTVSARRLFISQPPRDRFDRPPVHQPAAASQRGRPEPGMALIQGCIQLLVLSFV